MPPRVTVGPDGTPGYRVLVCGSDPEVAAGPMRIATDHGLGALASADTIVVPARYDPLAPTPDGVDDALHAALVRGACIASICVGAFPLAAAGILDGRRATTHWLAEELLRKAFPAVHLDADVLYVDEGPGADLGGRVGRS